MAEGSEGPLGKQIWTCCEGAFESYLPNAGRVSLLYALFALPTPVFYSTKLLVEAQKHCRARLRPPQDGSFTKGGKETFAVASLTGQIVFCSACCHWMPTPGTKSRPYFMAWVKGCVGP